MIVQPLIWWIELRWSQRSSSYPLRIPMSLPLGAWGPDPPWQSWQVGFWMREKPIGKWLSTRHTESSVWFVWRILNQQEWDFSWWLVTPLDWSRQFITTIVGLLPSTSSWSRSLELSLSASMMTSMGSRLWSRWHLLISVHSTFTGGLERLLIRRSSSSLDRQLCSGSPTTWWTWCWRSKLKGRRSS